MTPLIIYYSFGGNTRRIAERIGRELSADLCAIETAAPYTGSYTEIVDQGAQEVKSGFMPPLKPCAADLSQYDTIILGSPVWWYTFAPAMKTFLHEHPLSGKQVYPFATNGGWLGHTFQDFEAACPGVAVKKGLSVRFDGTQLRTEEAEILNWVKHIGK